RLAFTRDANRLALMHARRDFHRHHPLAKLPAAPAAVGAGIAHDSPAATAVGTGGDHAEHPAEALLGDAALPAALHADDRRNAGLRPAALARLADVLLLKLQRLFGAGGDFLESEFDLSFEIEPACL